MEVALAGTAFPAPPVPLGADDPGPLRRWMARALLEELSATASVVARVVVVTASRRLEGRYPLRPLPDEALGSAWGAFASQPGALRTFRLGLVEVALPGGPGVAGCVAERMADGSWWAAWSPVPTRPGPLPADALRERVSGAASEVHGALARWTAGFGAATESRRVEARPPPPLPAGSAVVCEAFPLLSRPPSNLDGLAEWFDRGVLALKPSLLAQAVEQPAVVMVRGAMFERWIVRHPQPAGLDDLVRSLCAVDARAPDAVMAVTTTSALVGGVQVLAFASVVEGRGRQLRRQLTPGANEPGWRVVDRRRLRDGEGWIGVPSNVALDLRPDGWLVPPTSGDA